MRKVGKEEKPLSQSTAADMVRSTKGTRNEHGICQSNRSPNLHEIIFSSPPRSPKKVNLVEEFLTGKKNSDGVLGAHYIFSALI